MGYSHRTIRVKLIPTADQAEILHETVMRFTTAFNFVCRTGWDAKEKNGVTLHQLTYRTLKDSMPDLVSDLHIQARVKATEAIGSALALARDPKRKVSCPVSQFCPPRYNVHTFKVDWASGNARLSTVAGKIDVPFILLACPAVVNQPNESQDSMREAERRYLQAVCFS